ncbi:MAG: S-layer homology domain-containing protein [Symploca sp. SIO2C1]|nr:S-layer homology domain-containing protein [Symploca sp. SIO2C1]
MSNSSPPEPPSSRRKILNKDEWIAIIVAFTTIAFIFSWVLGRKNGGFNLKDSQFTLNLPKPASVPTATDEQIASPPTIPGLDGDSEQLPSSQAIPGLDGDSEQLRSSQAIPGLDGDSEQLRSSQAILGLDSDSQQLDGEQLDSEQSPSSQATGSPDDDMKELPSSAITSSITSQESRLSSEEETASPESTTESPAAIAPTTSPTTSPTPLGEPIEFSDVPEEHWANRFILVLSAQQIIAGFPGGKFLPNKPVTRAELAALIQNVFEKDNTKDAIAFNDIPADYWANPAIDEAVKTGFMKGYPGEIFRPSEKVPRVQVLVALASGLDTTPPSTPDKTVDIYQDKEQIPKWAIEKVATATESGLVVNYPEPELLNPNKPATRAEVAAMIYQALVISGQAEEFSSEYIIPPTTQNSP